MRSHVRAGNSAACAFHSAWPYNAQQHTCGLDVRESRLYLVVSTIGADYRLPAATVRTRVTCCGPCAHLHPQAAANGTSTSAGDVYVYEPVPLNEGEEKHVISVFVADESGLINRVAGVFGRRGANIESLAVGLTQASPPRSCL